MPADPENLVLTSLRRIDARLANVEVAAIEIKERLGTLGQQYANMSRRIDRMDGDLQQVRRRLDLVDEAAR